MRLLRYAINLTLDGCCDHMAVVPDEEMHRHHAENLARADALLFGRVTYEMMEEGWRAVAESGVPGEGMPAWVVPFARTIDAARKHVVSSTLASVDWNSELLRGDLREAVERLKGEPGGEILTGGVTLPRALAEWGLIDEYEFMIHPRIVGGGRTLFAGLPTPLDLRLVDRRDFRSGAVVLRYRPRKTA